MTDFSKITIDESASIAEVIRKIDEGGYRLCFVLGPNNTLLGVVTDSELRRALLKGVGNHNSVLTIMNDNPVISDEILEPVEVRNYYDAYNITHIPIVSKNNKLIDIIECKNMAYVQPRSCSLLIVAGGRGSRLGQITKTVPKPLVKVGGVTIIEHIIFNAVRHGIKNIVIAVRHFGDQIISHLNDGASLGVNISYIREAEALGTAGCLALFPKNYKDDVLCVSNADIISKVDWSALLLHHKISKASISIGAAEVTRQSEFGVLRILNDCVLGIDEKPVTSELICGGAYVLNSSTFKRLGKPVYLDMPTLIQNEIKGGQKVSYFKFVESWTDIGRPDDLKLLESKFKYLRRDR